MPSWRLREATALLLGLDPDEQNRQLPEFKDLHRVLKRAKRSKLIASPLSAKAFLEWANSNRIPVQERLREEVFAQRPLRNWRKRSIGLSKELKEVAEKQGDPELNKRSRPTLERLMLGFALRYHRIKPHWEQFNISAIEHDLTFDGVTSVGASTIRKWIRHGLERQNDLVDRARKDQETKEKKSR